LAHPRDKVIYVNHGVIDKDTGKVSLPAVNAFADRSDLLAIIHRKATELLSYPEVKVHDKHETKEEKIPLPKNIRVASYLPHTKILPLVGVLISYAEYINVLASIRCGVPMVCIVEGAHMRDVGSRVVWCGARVELIGANPREKEIRQATFRDLEDKKFREAAEKVKEEFSKHNPAQEAAGELERAVGDWRGLKAEP